MQDITTLLVEGAQFLILKKYPWQAERFIRVYGFRKKFKEER